MSSFNHDEFRSSLDSLPWNPLTVGLREKVYESSRNRFRLVEFTHPFEEPDWCMKRHSGYVLKGEMIVNVDGKLVTFRAGDAVDLPAGTRHKHAETVATTVLFLVEDVDENP